jgi:hypothetical protein
MTYEVYSSGGIDCDLLQEPEWSDPPTDAEEDSNDASKQESNSACEAAEQVLPIIIHVSDCSVSSDSGSSDSNEPISRKARKLAVKMAAKKQTSQPKCNIRDYYFPISSAVHRNNVNAQMTPDVMNLWSVVAIGTSRDLDNNDAQSTTDASSSSSCGSTPVECKNGYVLDDFVVASSDSDNDEDDEEEDDDDI